MSSTHIPYLLDFLWKKFHDRTSTLLLSKWNSFSSRACSKDSEWFETFELSTFGRSDSIGKFGNFRVWCVICMHRSKKPGILEKDWNLKDSEIRDSGESQGIQNPNHYPIRKIKFSPSHRRSRTHGSTLDRRDHGRRHQEARTVTQCQHCQVHNFLSTIF